MVGLVVTPSLDHGWVRPMAALRGDGVLPIACVIDPVAHLSASLAASGQPDLDPSQREPLEQELRALLHALAEHDVWAYVVRPGLPLGEQLSSARRAGQAVAA